MEGDRRPVPHDLELEFTARCPLVPDDPIDRVVRRWNASILKSGDDEVIGSGAASVVSLDEAYSTGIDVFVALDSISAELEHLSVIYDYEEAWWSDDLDLADPLSNALLLESLRLEPAYRGLGLGPAVLAGIIARLGTGCAFAALEPHPIGDPFGGKTVDEAVRSLEQLWRTVGFEPFRDGVWALDLGTTTFERRRSELLAWRG